MLAKLREFIESRTGFPGATIFKPVPGGARFLHVPGTVLLLVIALQFLTGFVIALHYAPSVTTAWASIVFFEDRIRAGWLVRGLHAWGASAIVLLALIHLVQVAWTGAYRKPRELNWMLGLALLVLVLVFAHTGYLLPWDQKGYWSTRVATGIAGATPVVGTTLQRVAIGGEDQGNLTLSHFYAVHVILMPLLLLLVVGAHLTLFRRHGPTPPADVSDDAPAQSWFPYQTLRNLIGFGVVAATMGYLAVRSHGAPLEAPADPASDFQPRPEWYFLPLYQLLKGFPPGTEFVGSEVLPGLILLALALLPWIDRSPVRDAKKRLVPLLLVFVPLGGAVLMGSLSVMEDAGNKELAAHRRAEAKDAALARRLFHEQGGIPAAGPLALLDRYPPRRGARLYDEHCGGCHGRNAKGPDLQGYLTQRWLEQVIREPGTLFKHDSMGQTDAKPDELAALAVYVASLDSSRATSLDAARVAKGKALFDDKQCNSCHDVTKISPDDEGPSLAGYGTKEWLVALMKNPAVYFGDSKNKMPAFAGKLSEADLDAIAGHVRGLQSPSDE
ncbi:MAG TPA: cytochrome b N-terminal domain-containing protein [Planctomycetota bacterium]|nr:cytochrome b N-terminal domain-containing protein [Planctomycetota bacterium]